MFFASGPITTNQYKIKMRLNPRTSHARIDESPSGFPVQSTTVRQINPAVNVEAADHATSKIEKNGNSEQPSQAR